jgi:hypothetical protein
MNEDTGMDNEGNKIDKKGGIGKEMGRNDEECVSYGSRNSWMGRILQGKGKQKRES